ncbi:MAG: aconitate hydratase [Bdellovibrionales bacterium]|nr:aconitate hydratase [Bdellovibrionales bacterium]
MFDAKKSPLFVKKCYEKSKKNLSLVKKVLDRPLTLAEKILFSHLSQPTEFKDKESLFLNLEPNRVIMQDVTAQMALLQFMLAGKESTAVPTTIHCDHLITAQKGVKEDLKESLISNKEVFDFLSSVANQYNIGFWKPGAGIIHQVVLENYAFPGALIIGTDSHTPNAGGLGSLAVGVGGADAVDVMAGFSWELKRPKILGVHLTGCLSGWASPKDVILKLLGLLTVKGGTNKIIEYFGKGTQSISCTGKATITNMGAELGASSSLFPYDLKMKNYLLSTHRESIAHLADQFSDMLTADTEVLNKADEYYDELIEIDLSSLEPHISGPHSPDRVRPLRKMKEEAKKEGWPVELSAALIGSCTNSSYEDIGLSAHVAKQAKAYGLKMPQAFLVTPGSELVKKTIERDAYMKNFQDIGALVLANACGPCIGQWQRNLPKGKVNTILNSFNRNFKGRNDANLETLSFIASPEIVTVLGLAGRLDFNPETDTLEHEGKRIQFKAPVAKELPEEKFVIATDTYISPDSNKKKKIKIKENSTRLQVLKPFSPWDGKDMEDLIVLCKARGKCTTDHISPAGFWLKYRGHLDKISDNLLLGAVNDWTGEVGRVKNIFNGEKASFSEVARDYKKRGKAWMIVGCENYGEGSSREHAAMTPRYLGAKVVLVKSFARIHETNLKKQGILPLTFINPEDENKFQPEDLISVTSLKDLAPGKNIRILIKHKEGTKEEILVKHSLNSEQIKWFKAGSSLNTLKKSLF